MLKIIYFELQNVLKIFHANENEYSFKKYKIYRNMLRYTIIYIKDI